VNDYMPARLRGTPPGKQLWLPCDRCSEVRPIDATPTGLLCRPCNPDYQPTRPATTRQAIERRVPRPHVLRSSATTPRTPMARPARVLRTPLGGRRGVPGLRRSS
jgi:hypothetical protein